MQTVCSECSHFIFMFADFDTSCVDFLVIRLSIASLYFFKGVKHTLFDLVESSIEGSFEKYSNKMNSFYLTQTRRKKTFDIFVCHLYGNKQTDFSFKLLGLVFVFHNEDKNNFRE